MIDVESTFRAHLTSLSGVTAVFGQRFFSGRYLPSGYSPSQGPAALFMVRGGGQDYSSHLFSPSIQVRVYADTESNARHAAQTLYDGINDTQARLIPYARLEDGTMPTLLSEPGSDWPYILMFFKVNIHNS